MKQYFPDRWVMLKITATDVSEGGVYYKVLASWYGGFAGSNSWKLSSGTKSARVEGDVFYFPQVSDSEYACHKYTYGISGYTAGVLLNWQEKLQGSGNTIEVMDEDTDFTKLEFNL